MIYSEVGDAGRDPWDEWRGDRGSDDAESTWRSASKDGKLTIATMFYEARANGWRDDGGHQKPTAEALAERKPPGMRPRYGQRRPKRKPILHTWRVSILHQSAH